MAPGPDSVRAVDDCVGQPDRCDGRVRRGPLYAAYRRDLWDYGPADLPVNVATRRLDGRLVRDPD